MCFILQELSLLVPGITLKAIFHRFNFPYSSFSLLIFTEAGDSWSDEETQLQLMQQTLVSAMMEGTDDSSTALPISTGDLQQVFAVKIYNFMDTKNIAAIICTCDCCEFETLHSNCPCHTLQALTSTCCQ